MKRPGGSWLKKMSQWIHISTATDWTWSFPNESWGHMKSLQMMRREKRKCGERKDGSEEGKLERIVIPFLFHRRIKSKLAGFPVIRKNHSKVFITYYEVEELHTMSFMYFLCAFLFSSSLCVPKASSSIHPSKRVHTAGHEDVKFRASGY